MSIKYMVVDADGQLYQRSAPRWDVALRDVGPEGWAHVRLHNAAALVGPEQIHLAAFVNDIGLIAPEKYARNPVGACLLATFGANVQPYAGPVLFTGWDPDPYGEDAEVRTLTDEQLAAIRRAHVDVRTVLGLDPGEPSADASPRWCRAMAQVADIARESPTPAITIITDPDEVLAALRRMR